jgi:type II secretory pathway predicted ATPase ExeA
MNENETTKDVAELTDLARRIHAWQERAGLTTARLIREFRGLGSDRTYRDLRAGRHEGYDREQQLAAYRAVMAQIEARDDGPTADPVWPDLEAVNLVRDAIVAAMRTNGSNRVVFVTGDSGSGKTTALRWMQDKYGSRIVALEASVVWEDRPGEFLGALLEASGANGLPSSGSQRLARAVDFLRRGRRMVAVDEAQHLGPRCLGTIKTLVNLTPGEWLLLGIPTLRRRLDQADHEEARQLSTNRLFESVRLGLTDDDVARYLAHVFPTVKKAQIKVGASLVRAAAAKAGNLAFVRDAARQAQAMTPEGEEPTDKIFAEAVLAVSGRR